MSGLNGLEASIVVAAPPEDVFDALLDLPGRLHDLPSFVAIELTERTETGFLARMLERYGGREVVVTSRFTFERPAWVRYEHVESPYGENRGRFTIAPIAGGTRLHQIHETRLDISAGTNLRAEWAALMDEQLSSIARTAERRAGAT